jgi:hypothetical protein
VPCLGPAISIRSLFVHVFSGFAVLDSDCQYRHCAWVRSNGMQYAVCSGRRFFGTAFCMTRDIFVIA